MTCATCRYWKCYVKNADRGECRRHTPLIVGESEEKFGCWPVVYEDDWCGEYRFDPEQYDPKRDGSPFSEVQK